MDDKPCKYCVETRQLCHDLNVVQRHHSDMCMRIADKAIKAKLIPNFNACGDGGIPTFAAIVSKIEEAIDAAKPEVVLPPVSRTETVFENVTIPRKYIAEFLERGAVIAALRKVGIRVRDE